MVNTRSVLTGPQRIKLARRLLSLARARAKKCGRAFNIREEDIVIPIICPVLGIRLRPNKGGSHQADHSATIDRINPKKGYIRGNVVVVSDRANRFHSNATSSELARVASYYRMLESR